MRSGGQARFARQPKRGNNPSAARPIARMVGSVPPLDSKAYLEEDFSQAPGEAQTGELHVDDRGRAARGCGGIVHGACGCPEVQGTSRIAIGNPFAVLSADGLPVECARGNLCPVPSNRLQSSQGRPVSATAS